MKVSFLVVLFNKKIHESVTLSTLVDLNDNDIDLVIFNNGPNSISDLDKDSVYTSLVEKLSSVTFLEDCNNIPLSVIYNKFFSIKNNSDAYVLFDDDSAVPADYVTNIYKNQSLFPVDLIIPRIFSYKDNSYHYPRLNDKVIETDIVIKGCDTGNVISIGSGIILFCSLIRKLKSQGLFVFDERYALYGVDYSLFRSIKKYNLNKNDICIRVADDLIHDLSSGSAVQEPWRVKERIIDHVLSVKYYSPTFMHKVYGLMRIIAKELSNFRFKNVFFVLCIYFKGKHPRC